MAVHRRWLVLVFGLLALLCCVAFLAAVVPFNAHGNRLWDLKVAAMADGSVSAEEFSAYDKEARQGPTIESKALFGIAGGCVVVMFMLLPVWVYSEPPLAVTGTKAQMRK